MIARLSAPDEGVSISLKYYREETECFSKWTSAELKKFSGMLKKVAGRNAKELQGFKPLCEPHKRAPAESRFKRHEKLSEELALFELKVDPSNKARVHGVFMESVFFLVWLDRNHAVFPE